MEETVEIKRVVSVEEQILPILLGSNDDNLKLIKKKMDVKIVVRGSDFIIVGDYENVEKTTKLLDHLKHVALVRDINSNDVTDAINMISSHKDENISAVLTDHVKVAGFVKKVVPKTKVQHDYINAIRDYDIVFGIGPAGTGKTYLAMAMAINLYLNKMVNRIILTRPAVEAGERLGFLPGDIEDKITPYLRPLYDALYSMLSIDKTAKLIEKGVIELAPLAFMRGRTLNDSFVILDEAQNTTVEQMKMFLTRLGFNSKAVITGDITQIDLPKDKQSGLVVVKEILKDVKGIKFISFTEKDVVRHPLVQRIIKAYEKYEMEGNKS
ncbi:phosphate starvation-induced protein PhoH [Deferribacter desulfuricans SSM1]|uniref:PhoH-like protein n=1 Tax=Deferribacter desulfuricans (strain DSM 14783 / JCM 11476 / NBRC 101012 / SSM1) TaxID=639282 RepID=D3PD74_DEFDS|nr:PhoH family protein [Deferribacter desulfuricans]BAI80547.1 phosphate starvation-induced protein PhoH [Deferribacter desulfuricans SSM1]